MAFCPSGVSGPKAGMAEFVAYNGTVLAGYIETILGPEAIPLAALVGVLSWDTPTFCASDPVTLPTFNAAEIASLFAETITGVPLDLTAHDKFIQLLQYYAWFQLCECKTAATPTPTAPTWPQGSAINPTGLAPSPGPCGSTAYGLNYQNFDAQVTLSGIVHDINNIGIKAFPQLAQRQVASSAFGINVQAIDLGSPPPTSVTFGFGPITSADANSASSSVVIKWYTSAAAEIAGQESITFSGNNIAGHTATSDRTVPSTARYATILSDTTDSFKTRTAEIDIDWHCPNANVFNGPCCPPDPVAQQLLQRILTLVTLVQRQAAPFGYVTGATHSTLSGNGELAIQGLLGAKVTPTSVPGHFGAEAGDPESLWLDSWIRWGNADGWAQREFLTASPYVTLPNLAGQFTKLGYTIAPGIVVDIQELVREV